MEVFTCYCDEWDVLFLVSAAESDVCGADVECEGFRRGCTKGVEGMVISLGLQLANSQESMGYYIYVFRDYYNILTRNHIGI